MDASAKEYLFGGVFLLAYKLQALGDSALEEITLKQWFLLMMMSNMEKDQPSVTEIAQFIGSTRQNVRKMLDTLAAKGYVSLRVNEADKRNLSVSLTEQTLAFFLHFEARGTAFLEQLFFGISPDLLNSSRLTFETLFCNLERMEEAYGKNRRHL